MLTFIEQTALILQNCFRMSALFIIFATQFRKNEEICIYITDNVHQRRCLRADDGCAQDAPSHQGEGAERSTKEEAHQEDCQEDKADEDCQAGGPSCSGGPHTGCRWGRGESLPAM